METLNYKPFGPEWAKEVKKLSKDQIIELFKNSANRRIELSNLCKLLLIQIKNQDLTIYPADENTPDVLQLIELELTKL